MKQAPFPNQESLQVINTAIIKCIERKIDTSFEDHLSSISKTPAIEALSVAVSFLSEKQNISKDYAAMILVDTIRTLDKSWEDYLLLEGIEKVKLNLSKNRG